MDWLLSPLGLTIESQVQEYKNRLKDDRSKIKEWNAGDMLRDVFSPGTREDLEKAARIEKVKDINKAASLDRGTIRDTLGNTRVNTTPEALKIQKLETEDDYDVRRSGLLATGAQNIENMALDRYNPQDLIDGMGLSGAMNLATKTRTANIELDEGKILAERMRQEGILNRQRNFQNTMALRQMGLSDQRLANQMEVNQMQNALQMRREDRADRRSERDKMMAMIAMLTQGLGNVGNILA